MTDKNRSVFILGGARSGKSRFAEELAGKAGGCLHYLATGRAWDDEMRDRISHHQERRGGEWTTHEAPVDIATVLQRLDSPDSVILIDCLTLWLTNLMMENADMETAFAELEAAIVSTRAKLILVSNEVGLGIVPENRMAREFRDHAGRLHQRVAAIAGEVYFVAAGLPLKMKG
ncbi:bifunctional adenosylcobinamide kinase/adenosylcobinamide-phosphate guanylyltransferase [Agrobacterium fabrum]|jgi:adenosylcobinamide kinase / adenosylcobinamide-phosphate guanylyltransferase|uniref:Bifunctional adenosylcobalamin biosynthesis protein n=1 Tax=Agrobacterium fabrum TaxID=1176649 RepID=A0A7Z7BIJ6_9HYPH|nr:bifunctional adenosylcobinamide kinase/adenosylcobinamide-phosphate guanylyltransferase [Agrobacterium fabrum]MCR6725001.1 bifunctional adenosylcobinamide kinase/adenosylcobinamide-phosphate guanylyltransferase [Agrobacterium fabrum]WCK77483.1 bifunctional adenosylcobinamide kinase/adenosylcobinamide-phosphate guanylyltransferase [Agrobacterium fabrum]WIE28579.1 bifunctional adenosylcobinamide kinase/adenosylcobinamide-phosphate guanylyltransferase [Agrobacterium fabrum]WIE44537.1 bifunction